MSRVLLNAVEDFARRDANFKIRSETLLKWSKRLEQQLEALVMMDMTLHRCSLAQIDRALRLAREGARFLTHWMNEGKPLMFWACEDRFHAIVDLGQLIKSATINLIPMVRLEAQYDHLPAHLRALADDSWTLLRKAKGNQHRVIRKSTIRDPAASQFWQQYFPGRVRCYYGELLFALSEDVGMDSPPWGQFSTAVAAATPWILFRRFPLAVRRALRCFLALSGHRRQLGAAMTLPRGVSLICCHFICTSNGWEEQELHEMVERRRWIKESCSLGDRKFGIAIESFNELTLDGRFFDKLFGVLKC